MTHIVNASTILYDEYRPGALCDPPKPRCSIALNMPSASNDTINAPTMTKIFILSNKFATLDRSTSYDPLPRSC